MKRILLIFVMLAAVSVQAQRRDAGSQLTYDLGASAGSYGDESYSEINLGLNWYWQEWLNWRNSVFSRFGTGQSASGLDSSMRFEYQNQGDTFGLRAFAGPGYRFSSKEMSAVFGEAGVIFKVGGLALGAGAKVMQYNSPGQDSSGRDRPKSDTSYFLILGGGGVL